MRGLKCSDISLSYTVPANKLPNIFQNLSFNCSISNPFEIVSKDFLGIIRSSSRQPTFIKDGVIWS